MKRTGKSFYGLLIIGVLSLAILAGCGTTIPTTNDDDNNTTTTSPSAQVVNNSGDSIYQVNVGDTIFALTGYDSSGGSTGFSDVAEGTNTVTVKQSSTSTSVSVNSLDSFQKNNYYAVNISKVSGSYCAELWQRLDRNSTFNDDTTRVLIGTTCTTTAPAAPTSVTATAGDGQVTINWSAVSDATSYNVYWSATTGVTKTNGTKISGTTSPYIHASLTNDTTYYYVVTAVNSSGESVESAQASATPSLFIILTIYTSPSSFNSATASLGTATVVNFESATACTGDTIQGCTAFDGSFYSTNGVIFSNPNGYPLYIAPAGLFWNSSKSLSVGRFPGDPLYPKAPEYEDDDLVMTFSTPVRAVGFDLIDSTNPSIEFKDSNGNIIATTGLSSEYTSYRTFIGIVSTNSTIKEVNIIDEGNDGDDVNYDDVTFYP